ncbi:MAG: TetR family transcriptional regulator [Acidimicrobiales bacterium]
MSPQRSDSLRTQAVLISTAEQLFSDRGIEGVSLSEINRAAGQRNKSALHYHFGSRDGLLKALLEKHRTQLDAERSKLLAGYGDAELTLHDAVSVMVRPLAERVDDRENGGVHYIRIMAQLSANPQHPLNSWLFNELPPAFAAIAPTLYRHIPRAPTLLRMRRAQLMNGTMFHALLLQTYAPTGEDGAADRRVLYTNDLIDCICGLLSAPVSDVSNAAIDELMRDGSAERAGDDRIPRFGPIPPKW